ncbi:MAG TPA: NADH-quinone oxidoreductase subunit A [Pirellulales bacterium]|nr:NADH-quinone oxidoreductase subunit A [Pirellulales bacterium]
MNSPSLIGGYLALFTSVGLAFVFFNLLIGYFVRPKAPNAEKLEVYECGEPTIGSSFVQFDLRFYVVALLFIIFDVEVAFFFPWATVYGKAVHLLDPRVAVATSGELGEGTSRPAARRDGAAAPAIEDEDLSVAEVGLYRELGVPALALPKSQAEVVGTAQTLALASILDIGVFFAVLLVGFAYVWRRGDLDWVRALSRERSTVVAPQPAKDWEETKTMAV